jgi:acetoacetate decarboxylase
LEIVKDTLTGTLAYGGQLVAMGTMGYKHENMAGNGELTTTTLAKTEVNLKLIPGVDGRLEICQLVAHDLIDIAVKGTWIGPGRLHLVLHVNAPVADWSEDTGGAPFCRGSDAALSPRHLRLQPGKLRGVGCGCPLVSQLF